MENPKKNVVRIIWNILTNSSLIFSDVIKKIENDYLRGTPDVEYKIV